MTIGEVIAPLKGGSEHVPTVSQPAEPETQHEEDSMFESLRAVAKLSASTIQTQRSVMKHLSESLAAEREARQAAEARLEWLFSNCKIIHWPKEKNAYPIEHNPMANKDGRMWLDAAMKGSE